MNLTILCSHASSQAPTCFPLLCTKEQTCLVNSTCKRSDGFQNPKLPILQIYRFNNILSCLIAKKLGCLAELFPCLLCPFDCLWVFLWVLISSKSNGVVVWYINVEVVSIVWTQNTISGLEATDLDTVVDLGWV